MNGYIPKRLIKRGSLLCLAVVAGAVSLSSCEKPPKEVAITETRELCHFDYDEMQRAAQNPFWAVQPLNWRRVTRTEHRVLNYRLGKQTEIAVGVSGGSIAANLGRWYRQFQKPPVTDFSGLEKIKILEGITGYVVEVNGSFAVKMGGASEQREDWALIGIIAQRTTGEIVTIKMTGPASEVLKQKQSLLDFAKSLKIITKSK